MWTSRPGTEKTRNIKINNDDTRQVCADKYIHPESVYSHVEEGNDFILQHVKRITKSFFVCGFKPPISEETINEFCTERDVKITHLRVFRNYKFDRAITQVNLEDDGHYEYILCDPYFCPRGIRCQP